MSFFSIFLFSLVGAGLALASTTSYVWPNPKTDFLEALAYQETGYNEYLFAVLARICPGVAIGLGRASTAEWLRTAYHDMATADVHTGQGGMDASISFELSRPENVGSAFNETLGQFVPFISSRSSMADMLSLGAIAAVLSCTHGSVVIPFRGGRIDATGPGPAGVPQPQEDLDSHKTNFERQGFNTSEMIGLVACGHTLGGVHGVDFPEIVNVTKTTVRRPL
jgi:hypothetical protein